MEEKMKEVKTKIVFCTNYGMCQFGLKGIDKPCSICRHRSEFILNMKDKDIKKFNPSTYKLFKILISGLLKKNIKNEIEPITIRVIEEFTYGCYRSEHLPLHQECVFKLKAPSIKCIGCARMQKKLISTNTEEIK